MKRILAIGSSVFGLVVLFNMCVSMDRVDSFINDVGDLKPNELSWIGFSKSDLANARNIKLSTDVDISAFVVEMEFPDKPSLVRFRALLENISSGEDIDCSKDTDFCDKVRLNSENIRVFTLERNAGVFKKVFWFMAADHLKVIGSTANPPHEYLR